MIQKLDLFQRGLHYKKEAMLEGLDPHHDGMFVMQLMIADINEKLNEVIDAVNRYMPPTKPAPNRVLELLRQEIESRKGMMDDILDKFVNKGEEVLIHAYPPKDAHDVCDVCLMPGVQEDPKETARALWQALDAARKRVIVMVHDSHKEEFAKLLARMPYHYEIYEPTPKTSYEIHIIDKEEGNVNVERPGADTGGEVSGPSEG